MKVVVPIMRIGVEKKLRIFVYNCITKQIYKFFLIGKIKNISFHNIYEYQLFVIKILILCHFKSKIFTI